MRRRALILSTVAAAGLAARARAQPATTTRIAYLSGRSLSTDAHLLQAFRDGLKAEGYVDGQTVTIDARWADGRYDRLPALVPELVKSNPNLFVAVGGVAVPLAVKAAGWTAPTVFVVGTDPVLLGLVSNLARPDGNMTGMVLLSSSLEGKRVDLLHEMLPAARSLALLVNPTMPDVAEQIRDAERAASTLGLGLQILKAQSDAELDAAFAALPAGIDGLAVTTDAFFIGRRERILALTAARRLPAIFSAREFADDGGLASYGTRLADMYRSAGIYAGRILKGAQPKDLPIQQPTTYELVVNLKAAKGLGLTLPPTFVNRAEEVIE